MAAPRTPCHRVLLSPQHTRRVCAFFYWYGNQVATETRYLGPLALIEPLLQRMRVAAIINGHIPADPQAEFDYGTVLSVLIAARLSHPQGLVNVARWAAQSGAELLWKIPADKLNDDRLGRALDAFFTQRHSILASLSLHVAQEFRLLLNELHFDPTALLFHGAYETSTPRAPLLEDSPTPSNGQLSPAHITQGWSGPDGPTDVQVVHAGLCSYVDELGPVPLFGHVVDGNQNGHTAVAEQMALLQQHLRLTELTLISDRGTYSVGHLARLYREGFYALCAAPWDDYRDRFRQHRRTLSWKQASYLSQEQQRRRRQGDLPQEHYDLAVLRHAWTDPQTKQDIPGRLIFAFSTADQKVTRQHRQKQLARIREGLQDLARSVAEGRRNTDPESVARRVQRVFGKQAAARYFRWQLLPLTRKERDGWTPPSRGCTRPTCRFEFTCDKAAVQRDAQEDGYAVLVTTVPQPRSSADLLFTKYKQQIYCEHAHHVFKGPLAVHPVFLKKPERVEALVFLIVISLQAYLVLQRQYRQQVPEDAPAAERHITTRTLFLEFRPYTLLVEETGVGRRVQPTPLTSRQREILQRLGFPTPAQTLCQRLPRPPT